VRCNKLEGVAAMEEYRQDSEAAGVREVVGFFGERQRAARVEVDRLQRFLAGAAAGLGGIQSRRGDGR
jgi:hypothetical protein